MEPAVLRKLIKVNNTYRVRDAPGVPRIAVVDTFSEFRDGTTLVTYHYNNERKSMWFLTAEEFVNKFDCG